MSLDDLRRTDALLRPLYCEHQGWFTWANVLARLGHPDSDPDELDGLRTRFAQIGGWTRSLQDGDPILHADGTTDAPDELARARACLRSVAAKMAHVGELHEASLSAPADDASALIFQVATHAWAAYAYENTVKAALGFAQEHGLEADAVHHQLPLAQQAVRAANLFVGVLEKGAPPDLPQVVREETSHLGGLFQARAAELHALADA